MHKSPCDHKMLNVSVNKCMTRGYLNPLKPKYLNPKKPKTLWVNKKGQELTSYKFWPG